MSTASLQGPTTGQPRALFLTPIWPSRGGNGLAMRAGLLLDALTRSYRVDLWCVPIAGGAATTEFSKQIEQQTEARLEIDVGWQLARRSGKAALRRLGRPSACRFAVSQAIAEMREVFGMPDYVCTVVLRSYLLPFALPLDRAGGRLGLRVLDLDDDEALTHRRLADLTSETSSLHQLGVAHRLEAELFETFEASAVPWAERLLTAQRSHAERLLQQFPELRVAVLPNAVEVPARLAQKVRERASGPRLLFVGNLSYAPNVAATRELAVGLLPALEQRGLQPELRLVGQRPAASVTAFARDPRVQVFADEPSLEEHYEWADQAVLPLRAGGGTRIKILESFAEGVPVVSTLLGAEDLDVENGRELLLGTSVSDLADGVEQLWSAPDQARAMAKRAHAWVRQHHDRRQVVSGLAKRLSAPMQVESIDPAHSPLIAKRSRIGSDHDKS